MKEKRLPVSNSCFIRLVLDSFWTLETFHSADVLGRALSFGTLCGFSTDDIGGLTSGQEILLPSCSRSVSTTSLFTCCRDFLLFCFFFQSWHSRERHFLFFHCSCNWASHCFRLHLPRCKESAPQKQTVPHWQQEKLGKSCVPTCREKWWFFRKANKICLHHPTDVNKLILCVGWLIFMLSQAAPSCSLGIVFSGLQFYYCMFHTNTNIWRTSSGVTAGQGRKYLAWSETGFASLESTPLGLGNLEAL